MVLNHTISKCYDRLWEPNKQKNLVANNYFSIKKVSEVFKLRKYYCARQSHKTLKKDAEVFIA